MQKVCHCRLECSYVFFNYLCAEQYCVIFSCYLILAFSAPPGQHLTDDYQNINRFKRIPCIVDGDFKLAESIAIYRYLASVCNVEDHWYPKDAKKRARVDEYLEWQHVSITVVLLFYTKDNNQIILRPDEH